MHLPSFLAGVFVTLAGVAVLVVWASLRTSAIRHSPDRDPLDEIERTASEDSAREP